MTDNLMTKAVNQLSRQSWQHDESGALVLSRPRQPSLAERSRDSSDPMVCLCKAERFRSAAEDVDRRERATAAAEAPQTWERTCMRPASSPSRREEQAGWRRFCIWVDRELQGLAVCWGREEVSEVGLQTGAGITDRADDSLQA